MKIREERNRKGWVRIKIGPIVSPLSSAQAKEVMVRVGRGEPAAGRRLFLSFIPQISDELRAAGLRRGRLLEAIQLLQDEFLSVLKSLKDHFPGGVEAKVKVVRKFHRSLTGDIPAKLFARRSRQQENFIFFLVRAGEEK